MVKVLSARAVAYINFDTILMSRQLFTVAASPLIIDAVYEAAKQVSQYWWLLEMTPHPDDREAIDLYLDSSSLGSR